MDEVENEGLEPQELENKPAEEVVEDDPFHEERDYVGWGDEDESEDSAGPDDDAESDDPGELTESDESLDTEPTPTKAGEPDRPSWLPEGFNRPEDFAQAFQQLQNEYRNLYSYATQQQQSQQRNEGAVPSKQQAFTAWNPPHEGDAQVSRATERLLKATTEEDQRKVLSGLPEGIRHKAHERASYIFEKQSDWTTNPMKLIEEIVQPYVQSMVAPLQTALVRREAQQRAQEIVAQNRDILGSMDNIQMLHDMIAKGTPHETALQYLRAQEQLKNLTAERQKVQSNAATQRAVREKSRRGGRKANRNGKHKHNDPRDPKALFLKVFREEQG